MSQSKNKFKEEVDQPSIVEFCNTPHAQKLKKGHHVSRSRSVKRKSPPSIEKPRESKRPLTETNSMAGPNIVPEELKQDNVAEIEVEGLDRPVLNALEKMLQPIKDDIKNLLSTQKELKEGLVECTRLREENNRLHNRIVIVEKKNSELCNRVSYLEDRILESSVIIQGLQESPWETEAVCQEKVIIAISETIIGRTLDDRIETARSMVIKGTH